MKVLFGAGRIGIKVLSFWRECGLNVDYFADNNRVLAGKKVEGIEVIPVETLLKLPTDTEVFITCKDDEPIIEQLLKLGIDKKQIKKCNTLINILGQAMAQPALKLPMEVPKLASNSCKSRVVFDLSFGLVIGGVESWSIQSSERLEKMGWSTALLVNHNQKAVQEVSKGMVHLVELNEDMSDWDKLGCLLPFMLNTNCSNLVCNFTGYNFGAACLAKKCFPNNIRVIAVVHNDEEDYYQHYMLMEQYIDKCLIISEKIKSKLLEKGFPEEKMVYLPLVIPFDRKLRRIYSSEERALRIGYSGRIVIKQKRMDYLISVAKILKKRGIKFILELTGTGTFEEELKAEIEKSGLQEMVYCLGVIERSELKLFWQRQDIMISCSDFEGHSATQCEAMAAGAVPVITDVSGARDDVTDGENGFIVEVGAVDQIAEKICFLDAHRELLPVMGQKAYRTIKEKNSEAEIEKLWKSILI